MSIAMTHDEHDWIPTDSFGARLMLIRSELGSNIKQAAELCAINPESWRSWEKGHSPQRIEEVARKIADATGCDYRWLMAGGELRMMSFALLDPFLGQLELDLTGRPELALC